MQNVVPRITDAWSQFILTTALSGRHPYPLFTDEENEAQTMCPTCKANTSHTAVLGPGFAPLSAETIKHHMILGFYTYHLSVSAILFCLLQNPEPLVCPLISLTDSSVFSSNSFSFLSSFQHNAFSFTWVIAPSLISGKCILSSCSHFTWLITQQKRIWVKDHFPPHGHAFPNLDRYSSSYRVNLHSNLSEPHLHPTPTFTQSRSKCNSFSKHLIWSTEVSPWMLCLWTALPGYRRNK